MGKLHPRHRPRRLLVGVSLLSLIWGGPAGAQPVETDGFELDPLMVTGDRQLSAEGLAGGPASSWDRWQIEREVPLTIDALLASDPAFSLYRRETAGLAHPTTQGANLRGLGANAAARALVLLDGIPQNDPFGGWVPWTRYPPIALTLAEVLPSSQAAVWGNLSAGGIVSLTSAKPFDERQSLQLSAGSLGYYDASVLRVIASGDVGLAFDGRVLRQDGDYLVHPGDRGAIDRTADLAVESLSVRGAWEASNQLRLEPSWGYFEEERGNGSPLARNLTRGWDVSLRGSGDLGDWVWEATGYYQRRAFENLFTAISDDRTSEVPVLDQWDMPGEGAGASVIAATSIGRSSRVLVGADTRRLEGATNEDYGIGLANRRFAGGVQWLNGAFAKGLWTLTEAHRIDATLRLDYWRMVDGALREGPVEGGPLTTDRNFANRSGVEPSVALHWQWLFEPRWRLQAGASRGFRLPTINELYRPYRVGADIFDANPQLEPERFSTVEVGLIGEPTDLVQVESGVFAAYVEDVIANVFVSSEPGPSPGGFVPAGGSYNRRANVDTSRVWGWQNRLSWQMHEQVSMHLRHRWLQSEFTESELQPALEGLRFPQIPRHAGSVELQFRPHNNWTLFGAVHGATAQYDDPLNQRRIDHFGQADLGFSWDFGRHWTLVGRVENVSDEIILTGIASDGERAIATGRAAWLTLQADY